MKLRLLLTGNELMAGDIIDSNSAMVAEMITPLGWQIERKVTVADDLPLLVEQIEHLCSDADVLLINGGLGPTVDDLTAQALAQVSGRPIAEHPDAMAHLQQWCQRLGFRLNEANYKQALLPSGCDIIANARGSAVGMRLEHRGCLVLSTPGVPGELNTMMSEEVLPLLQRRFESDRVRIRRLAVFGLGESSIQHLISQQLGDWPAEIELGFRASMPVMEVKLSARGEVPDSVLDHWQDRVMALLDDHLLGPMPTSLPAQLIDVLRQQGLSLCTAESCTGGLIASQITAVAGASEVFPGAIVSYSNAVKQGVLGVSEASLAHEGAVSESVVLQMAEGALRATGATTVLAVSGVAGPDGGSDDKPVGTVWIAWGLAKQLQAVQLRLPFDRQGFQMWAAAIAIDLLRRQLLDLPIGANLVRRFRVSES